MISIFKKKEEVFLEKDVSGEKIYTSESYDRLEKSLKALSGKDLDEGDKILDADIEFTQKIVDQIHLQASKNLKKWDSIEYPGVSELMTTINVIDLLDSLGIESKEIQSAKDSKESLTKELTVMSSSTPSGATLGLVTGSKTAGLTDGGSHTGFDVISGRIMQELSRVVGSIKRGEPINSEIILTGSPLATGGSVTSKYAERVRKNGIFETQAKLHAEMLKPIIEDEKVRHVVFTGHSFAATQSIFTANQLPSHLYKKISVLADDPVITHGNNVFEAVKGIQVILGAMLDGAFSSIGSYNDDAKAKPIAHKSYIRQLERLGISYNDSLYNEKLKSQLHWTVLKQVILGPLAFSDSTLFDNHKFKIYMRKGMYDPTKISIKRIFRYLDNLVRAKNPIEAKQAIIETYKSENTGRGKQFPIKKFHSLDRFTPKYLKRWIKTGREIQSMATS